MTATDYRQPADATVGADIRSRRLARRWSAMHLARWTGLSKSYIRAVEKGRRRPTDETLANILAVLEDKPPSALTRGQRHKRRLAEVQARLDSGMIPITTTTVWDGSTKRERRDKRAGRRPEGPP